MNIFNLFEFIRIVRLSGSAVVQQCAAVHVAGSAHGSVPAVRAEQCA
jgi:hypothetical protein